MKAKELLSDRLYEEDTFKLLDISLHFLVRFFGHSEHEARVLLKKFDSDFSEIYDEDVLHHESSYRIAAFIHYLVFLSGDGRALGEWLQEEGHVGTPPEAAEYFRKQYFIR